MANENIIFEDPLNGSLSDGWSWLREHSDYWRLTDTGLEIRVEPGVKDTVRNALLRPAPDRSSGTFAIEVNITNHTRPTQQYEQAGITWYSGGEPIFKLVKEFIDGDLYIIPGRQPMPIDSVRLRLIVTAESWEAQYRPDGESTFHTAKTGDLPPPGNDQVSIQCYNGPEEGAHWISFANFQITRLG